MRIKKREKVNQPTTPSRAVSSRSSFQSLVYTCSSATFVPVHRLRLVVLCERVCLRPFRQVLVPWKLCPGSSLKFALISTSFVASATSSATIPPLSPFLPRLFLSHSYPVHLSLRRPSRYVLSRLYNILAEDSHKSETSVVALYIASLSIPPSDRLLLICSVYPTSTSTFLSSLCVSVTLIVY